MKQINLAPLTIIILLAALVSVCAAGKAIKLKAACPECGALQTFTTTNVTVNGCYATNVAGVAGSAQQATAQIACHKCKAQFRAEVKPDKFIPKVAAAIVGD